MRAQATERIGVTKACNDICKGCGRSFTSRGERFSKPLRAQALEMYLNHVGIRKIARFVKASPARLIEQLEHAQQLLHQHLPAIIEIDEIYTFAQKNSSGLS